MGRNGPLDRSCTGDTGRAPCADPRAVWRLATRALDHGGAWRGRWVEYPIAPWCEEPVTVELWGGPDARPRHNVPDTRPSVPRAIGVRLGAACRKCSGCLRHKRKIWRARAMHETLTNDRRTWFVTLTFRPDSQLAATNRARRRLSKEGVDFDGLGANAQYVERGKELYSVVQKYFKRLRKGKTVYKKDGTPLKEERTQFRYFVVMETENREHEEHLHFHAVIHEMTTPITERRIRRHWYDGFAHAKLVSNSDVEDVSSYCTKTTKYLTKSDLCRVRASKHYGALKPSERSERENKEEAEDPPDRTTTTGARDERPGAPQRSEEQDNDERSEEATERSEGGEERSDEAEEERSDDGRASERSETTRGRASATKGGGPRGGGGAPKRRTS